MQVKLTYCWDIPTLKCQTVLAHEEPWDYLWQPLVSVVVTIRSHELLDILKMQNVLQSLSATTLFYPHYVNETRKNLTEFLMQCKFDVVFLMCVSKCKISCCNPFPFTFLMVKNISLFWEFQMQHLDQQRFWAFLRKTGKKEKKILVLFQLLLSSQAYLLLKITKFLLQHEKKSLSDRAVKMWILILFRKNRSNG